MADTTKIEDKLERKKLKRAARKKAAPKAKRTEARGSAKKVRSRKWRVASPSGKRYFCNNNGVPDKHAGARLFRSPVQPIPPLDSFSSCLTFLDPTDRCAVP